MLRFVISRLLSSVVVIFIIITASFFLMRFAPGSPFDAERKLPPNVEANKWLQFGMGVEVYAPEGGEVTEVAKLAPNTEHAEGTFLAEVVATGPVQLGLVSVRDVAPRKYRFTLPNDGELVAFPVSSTTADEPTKLPPGGRIAVLPKTLAQQFLDSVANYARFDFGVTITSDGSRTVNEELAKALPISLNLGIMALIFALLFGVTAGLVSGLKQNTWVDYTLMSGAMVGISVPSMVSGPLFIAIFALGLGWFPVSGWEAYEGSEWSTWQYRVLPVITLGLAYTASFARITRGGMLEIIRSDYIRTARAKGVRETQVVTRHALKGAILPTVTFLGPALAGIVTGSVVVERVFGIPGLSEYFVTPAINRDYPMVLGVVVVYSCLLVLLNLLVDIAYTFLDPRVSYD